MTEVQLDGLLARIERAELVCIDLMTTQAEPMHARERGQRISTAAERHAAAEFSGLQ